MYSPIQNAFPGTKGPERADNVSWARRVTRSQAVCGVRACSFPSARLLVAVEDSNDKDNSASCMTLGNYFQTVAGAGNDGGRGGYWIFESPPNSQIPRNATSPLSAPGPASNNDNYTNTPTSITPNLLTNMVAFKHQESQATINPNALRLIVIAPRPTEWPPNSTNPQQTKMTHEYDFVHCSPMRNSHGCQGEM